MMREVGHSEQPSCQYVRRVGVGKATTGAHGIESARARVYRPMSVRFGEKAAQNGENEKKRSQYVYDNHQGQLWQSAVGAPSVRALVPGCCFIRSGGRFDQSRAGV
jgi:hypothetical protein